VITGAELKNSTRAQISTTL